MVAEKPKKDIYDFVGLFKTEGGGGGGGDGDEERREPLNLENTMWANTFLAAGKVIGLVMYTGD